jgi:hypothetical protein
MATYSVKLPFAGYLSVEVEADSEEDAVSKAMNDASLDDVEEWETFTHIVQGNVLYAPINTPEVELIDDGEDEDEL